MIPPIVIYTGVGVVTSLIGAMISRRRMREIVAEQIQTLRSETDAAVTKQGLKLIEVGETTARVAELLEQVVEQVNWLSSQQGKTATIVNDLVDKVGGVEKLRQAAHAAMPGTMAFNSFGSVEALKQHDPLTAAGFTPPPAGSDDDTVDGDIDWVARREAMQV